MSVPAQFGVAANNGTMTGGGPSGCAMQHLHLHMKRTHWETKHHENLGAHLQDALDALDREGWEVVDCFVVNTTPEVILRRPVPPEG